MIVVDSSGWLEYFGKGENGPRFAPAIQETSALIVPVICLYEVFKRVALQRGEEEALQAVGVMMAATVVDVTSEIALFAAQLSMDHKLPRTDSLILAVARRHAAELWTQDEHFNGLDAVRYFAK